LKRRAIVRRWRPKALRSERGNKQEHRPRAGSYKKPRAKVTWVPKAFFALAKSKSQSIATEVAPTKDKKIDQCNGGNRHDCPQIGSFRSGESAT
jgi:hypothetical protein